MPDIKRSLNLFDTVMLVSGSMIGSGIFIVSADMMRVLGSPFWVLMCWIISGVITIFAALSYGELAGMMPSAGGQFIYLKRAYGELSSFVYGWTVFTVIQTGVIAAVAVAFARYCGVFIPFFDEKHILMTLGSFTISSTQMLAMASIFLLTYLNTLGINNGKIIQRLFTSTKLLALLGLILIGFAAGYKSGYWHTNIALPFQPGGAITSGSGNFSLTALLGALGVALIGSLFSSDAWNNVTFIAGEIRNPKRNIGLALFLGTLIVTIIYVSANLMYISIMPLQDIAAAPQDRVAVAASKVIFGDIGTYVIAVMIMISTFGCNNGLILAGARVYNAMANDKLFFKKAAILNKHAVPEYALWAQCIMASLLCLSGRYGDLLDMISFVVVLFYALTILGIFRLRSTRPEMERPYKALGYPVLPVIYILLAIVFCVFLIIMKPLYAGIGLGIVLAGIPVYYLTVNQQKN